MLNEVIILGWRLHILEGYLCVVGMIGEDTMGFAAGYSQLLSSTNSRFSPIAGIYEVGCCAMSTVDGLPAGLELLGLDLKQST